MSVAVVIPSISASQPRSFWSTFIRDAAIVACIVGILRLCLVLLTLHGAYRRGDFSIYYTTATAMREGHNPYLNLDGMARRLGFTPLPFDHAADSPAFILSMEPLTYFAPPTAYLIWVSASAAALVFAALLLFGAPAGVRWRPALVMFLFALGFTPVADNFTWAQTQIFVLLGLVIVMRLAQHGFDRAAGALLAILGLLRIFPLVIGGYLLVRKKWSAITSLAVTFAAGAAFVVALAGPPGLPGLLSTVLAGHP